MALPSGLKTWPSLVLVLIATFTLLFVSPASATEHTSNWAVLVSTSRFWFNYRHMANVLSLYRTVKRLGIPDSQIILMLPDDMACNPRNIFPGTVHNNADRAIDLYGDNVEVDYRGYEVTVENFIRLLTDRVGDDMPTSKRLLTDERSNVLVYMTGHGGDEFLKFQDAEEIGAWDLAHAFAQMWEKRRYNELLFMIDTCQANTMFSRFYSPNIIATGSSDLGESSYSHHSDPDVGVAVIDRWTYSNLDFLETHVRDHNCKLTLGNLFDSYDVVKVRSRPGFRWDLFPGGEARGRERLLVDFFGNVQNVQLDDTGAGAGEGHDREGDGQSRWNETAWREQMGLVRRRWEEHRRRMDLPTDDAVTDDALIDLVIQNAEQSVRSSSAVPERKLHQQTHAGHALSSSSSILDRIYASGSSSRQGEKTQHQHQQGQQQHQQQQQQQKGKQDSDRWPVSIPSVVAVCLALWATAAAADKALGLEYGSLATGAAEPPSPSRVPVRPRRAAKS